MQNGFLGKELFNMRLKEWQFGFLLIVCVFSSVASFAAPSITSLSPTSGAVGSSVTITGATTGNVVVTVSGVASSGKSFTVLPTPSITSLSTTTGAVGASVTITGANFG